MGGGETDEEVSKAGGLGKKRIVAAERKDERKANRHGDKEGKHTGSFSNGFIPSCISD